MAADPCLSGISSKEKGRIHVKGPAFRITYYVIGADISYIFLQVRMVRSQRFG